MKKIVALLLLLQTHVCLSQNMSFFKDINHEKNDAFSTVNETILYKGELYFFMRTQTYGTELWKTDGTVAGTQLVKDITPGAESVNNGSFFTIFNNILYFKYGTPDLGTELWQTDGTAAGTQLFFESINGQASGFGGITQVVISQLPVPTMYFCVLDSGFTYSLYKYTGIQKKPQKFYSYTKTNSYGTTLITSLYVLGGKLLFFRSENGINGGMEPWVTDGTKHGTRMLKNINTVTGTYSGSQNSSSGGVNYFMGTINGSAYFNASDTAHGCELWKTDGTTHGTLRVKDTKPGTYGGLNSGAQGVKLQNGNIMFPVNSNTYLLEPWVTNGTNSGTQLMKHIKLYDQTLIRSSSYNGLTFMMAGDTVYGQNPYVTDGSDTGTFMIQDVFPGEKTLNALNFLPANLNNGALFYGYDTLVNAHLFITDGTAGNVGSIGTYYSKNINGTIYKPWLQYLGTINNKMLYRVMYTSNPYRIYEYYLTDGTAAGTMSIDFSQVDNENYSSNPICFTKYNGEWFFIANNGIDGTQLWKTDGTVGGTFMFKNFSKSSLGVSSVSTNCPLYELNGSLYFVVSGKFVKYTGGSPANFTVPIPSIPIQINGFAYKAGQQLFFGRDVPINGYEPWRFNGTGISQMEINTANNCNTNNITYCSSNPVVSFVRPNNIIFTAKEDDGRTRSYRYSGGSLWNRISEYYQGTDIFLADTGRFFYYYGNGLYSSDIHNGPGWHVTINGVFDTVAHVVAYKDTTFYFAAKSGNSGNQLWKSNGTLQSTVLVKTINPTGNAFEKPTLWNTFKAAGTFLNNEFYFFANDGVHGYELWKSDGTGNGTVMVKDINPTGGSKENFHAYDWNDNEIFIRIGNNLYFIADDGIHGYEVWVTDGTAGGTHLTTDINITGATFTSNYYGSYPKATYSVFPFTTTDSIYVFNAFNGYAKEAYYIDFTTSTIKLFDVNKGYPDNFSNPALGYGGLQGITAPELGLISALSPTKGYELYKYSVTPPPNPNLVCALNSGCAGDSLTITYAITSRVNAGNIITLQMSDAAGSFATPVTISTFSATSSSQTFAIPALTPAGNNYRFRLTTTNPVAILPDNGTDVVIASTPFITNCVDSIFAYAQPGLCGAYVNYNLTAVATPQGESDYSKTPNSFFATGITPVYFTAWNGCGYDTCYFTVVVRDSISPLLACPADITTATPVVTFTAAATDNCGTAVVTFNPPSGTSFPLGTTMVTATATDSSGNTSSCQFAVNITVMRMEGQITEPAIQTDQFEISPVPVNEFLNIGFDVPVSQAITVTIKNVTGVVCYTNNITAVKGTNSFTLKTGKFHEGIYVVEITGNNMHGVRKVLFKE